MKKMGLTHLGEFIEMSNRIEQKNVRIKGRDTIIGDGNTVNSNNNNHNHNHNHHHHHTSSKSNGGDDAMGIGFAALAAFITTVWFFVKNAELVYGDLKLGAIISVIPSLLALLIMLLTNGAENERLASSIYGIVTAALGFILSSYALGQLPQEILDFSHRTNSAWAFWHALDHTQENAEIGSLVCAVCAGGAVLLNFAMGIFVSIDALVDGQSGVLLRMLNPFRPSGGGIMSAIFLVAGAAFASGLVFEFIDSVRASFS